MALPLPRSALATSSCPRASCLLRHASLHMAPRRASLACRAGGERKTMPIFPLGVVALPSAHVPLMIFEARYRVLFNTLLSGMPGIEEGLVQTESPWCGSKRFGMCYVDQEGRMASVGCTLEITDFQYVPDGRLFVSNKGRERFRVTNVVKEKPVLLCEVEVLPEEEESDAMRTLGKEVAELLRTTIKLNVKMQALELGKELTDPKELDELGPRDLSFWVASFFSDIKILQQNLLEENDTMQRLQKEKEVLAETVRYYSAAAALKSAFSSPSSSTPSPSTMPSSTSESSSSSSTSSASEGSGAAEAEARVAAEADDASNGKDK